MRERWKQSLLFGLRKKHIVVKGYLHLHNLKVLVPEKAELPEGCHFLSTDIYIEHIILCCILYKTYQKYLHRDRFIDGTIGAPVCTDCWSRPSRLS